jgi:hypothetical protein
MDSTHRRPLVEAARAVLHTVCVLTVLLGSVVRANGMPRQCAAGEGERLSVRTRLVPAKDIGPAMIEVVQEEVVELWRPYGVDIVWEDEWLESSDRPKPELFVLFVDRELERGRGGATPVAWIQFLNGAPGQLINVSMPAAKRLLSEAPWHDQRPIRMAPTSAQERLAGRMIGRALAHEIGHYLLATSTHARLGLMKPLISPAEFVKEGRKHLQLEADDVRVLRTSRLTSCQLTASR